MARFLVSPTMAAISILLMLVSGVAGQALASPAPAGSAVTQILMLHLEVHQGTARTCPDPPQAVLVGDSRAKCDHEPNRATCTARLSQPGPAAMGTPSAWLLPVILLTVCTPPAVVLIALPATVTTTLSRPAPLAANRGAVPGRLPF